MAYKYGSYNQNCQACVKLDCVAVDPIHDEILMHSIAALMPTCLPAPRTNGI